MKINPKYYDLLLGKNFAHLATVNPDGSPQVTPIWIDFDVNTGLIWFNTARGRKKDRNLQLNSKVALSILDQKNPYRYIAIQGQVNEITEEGGEAHIDMLANKYYGRPFGVPKGQIRLKISVRLNHVFARG